MIEDRDPFDDYNRIVLWGMGPFLDEAIDLLESRQRLSSVVGIVKHESEDAAYRGIPIIREIVWRDRFLKRVLVVNCAARRNREKIERRIRRQRLDFLSVDDYLRAYKERREAGYPSFISNLNDDLASQRESRQGRFFFVREISRFLQRRRRRYPMVSFESSYDDYWIKRRDNNSFSISPSSRYRATVIAQQIEPNSSLLDIGCGDGTFIKEIDALCDGVKCDGIDLSSVAVEIANSRGVQAYQQDITVTPIDKKYDYITLMCVLEHVVDAELLAESLKGKFKKKLFIAVPNMGYIEHRIDLAIFGKTPITTIVYHMKEHVRFWSHRDFVYWLEQMGYSVKAHYGLYGGVRLWAFHKWFPSLTAANILYEIEQAADLNP